MIDFKVRVTLTTMFGVLLCTGCDKKEPTPPALRPPSAEATLAFAAAPPPASGTGLAKSERVHIDDLAVPSGPSKVHVAWIAPPGTGVNDEAPFKLRWRTSDGLSEPPEDVAATGAAVSSGFDVALRPNKGTRFAKLLGDVSLVVCDVATHSVCVPVRRELEMSFAVGTGTTTKPARAGMAGASAKNEQATPVATIQVSVPLPAARAL
jgi:hypothetical protein